MIKNLSFLVVLTTSFLNYSVPIQETKTEVHYSLGKQNVISNDLHLNIISGGDSLAHIESDLQLHEQELRRQSERRQSGQREKYSPSYESSPEAEIIGNSKEQCVIYAKRVTGISKTIGYAGRAKVEGQTPTVGAIMIEVKYGHAGVVESIREDGIMVTESNFIKGKITRRFIPYNDIRGYIYAS